jgi:hypothetical protein
MFWDPPPGRIDYWLTKPVYGSAEPAPGFISALYQIKFKIPDSLGPGVTYLPTPGVLTRVEIWLGNRVGVYVQ